MDKKPLDRIKKLLGEPVIDFDENLFSMDSKAVEDDSIAAQRPALLLNRFSSDEIKAIFNELNIMGKLQKSGFRSILFDIDIKSYLDQRICIFYDQKDRQHLLIEIRMTTGDRYRQIKHSINKREYRFLLIDWLVMQNPTIGTWEKKRRLPGQDYPGLYMGYALIDFFQIIAKILELDGLLCFPEFFHNAYFYSRYFYFADFFKQAEFLSILRDFCLFDIDIISHKIEGNEILDKDNNIYEWRSREQVMPIEPQLISYFNSDRYIKTVQDQMKLFIYKDLKESSFF